MTTITYCKGLPTPADELNPIGFTDLEMFLTSLSNIFYQATVETVNHLLNKEIKFNQATWNSHIQEKYGISKRYANGVISLAKGKTASATYCRKRGSSVPVMLNCIRIRPKSLLSKDFGRYFELT
jgi:hypothetical protein